MNQLEIYDEALKALLAIAATKPSNSAEELKEDIDGIIAEAQRVLRLAGYDFNMLMNINTVTRLTEG